MRKALSISYSLSTVIFLVILLAACGQESPETTATPPADETPVFTTPEPELTVPSETDGTDAAPGEEDETPAATSEVEASETPPSSLTAVIVSGDSAGAGKPFTFDATQSLPREEPIVSYVWSMGDGTTLFGISVEHVYSEPGFYTVTLIISDAAGLTDVAVKVVEIVDLDVMLTPTAESESALVGSAWELSNAIRGTRIILIFNERVISGSSGCNDYNANYTRTIVDDATTMLSVLEISTTDNTCTSEVMAQERGYLDSLASTSRAMIDDDTLTLTTGSGTLTFSRSVEGE